MKRAYLGLGLLLLLVQACGDSTSAPVPDKVSVSPSTTTMDAVGQTLQYSARLMDTKGREIEGVAFTWAVSNQAVASITPSGLVTGIKAGASNVRATAEGVTGSSALTVDPIPSQVTKITGDEQQGILRQVLPGRPTVEVLDGNGNPVQGKWVTFSVVAGGGQANPVQVQTGTDGRASTVWQLGCSNDNPQRLNAGIGSLTVSFTATADLDALAICKDAVPDGRETHPYSTALEAAGGDQSTLTWSLLAGALPPGLTLLPGGELSGTPDLRGTYQFEAFVQDDSGASASAVYGLQVCEAPVQLAPGEARRFAPSDPDGCGFFLPAGDDGDRYRVGVVYAQSDHTNPNDVPQVVVDLKKEVGGALSSQRILTAPSAWPALSGVGPRLPPQASRRLQEDMERARATRDLHHRIRLAERDLLRKLGPNARPLPDAGGPARVSGPAKAAPDKMSFTNSSEDFSSCAVKETVRAVKIKENDHLVIYQDSIQWSSDPLADNLAQSMLDHYVNYGKQVIDDYFGGVTDINSDGQIVLFVTPVLEAFENTIAFVWAGDFFPKTTTERDGVTWEGCPASNEMEMMRFSLRVIKLITEENFAALGTVVHETKHISSLYKSIIRSVFFDTFSQPDWVEEGVAEIAEEVASRIAWAGTGGPAVGAMARRDDVTGFNQENYGAVLVNAGTVRYLSSQPNGVVVTPNGAGEGHSVYGSGWHFHRWLGDAYGNAASPLAEASLFRTLNDSLTAAGAAGVLSVTGVSSWGDLMAEYLTGIMLNGTGAPQGSKAFSSYDFPSFTSIFSTPDPDGDYPWPVNTFGEDTTAPFGSATFIGPIGPSGVRIFDLSSDGTGLGLDVTVTAPGSPSSYRIVLVRIE